MNDRSAFPNHPVYLSHPYLKHALSHPHHLPRSMAKQHGKSVDPDPLAGVTSARNPRSHSNAAASAAAPVVHVGYVLLAPAASIVSCLSQLRSRLSPPV